MTDTNRIKRYKDIVEYLALKTDLKNTNGDRGRGYSESLLEKALERSFSKPGSLEIELNDTGERMSECFPIFYYRGFISKVILDKKSEKEYHVEALVKKFNYVREYYSTGYWSHSSCCEQRSGCDCRDSYISGGYETRDLKTTDYYKIKINLLSNIFSYKNYNDYKKSINAMGKTANIKTTSNHGCSDEAFKQYIQTLKRS